MRASTADVRRKYRRKWGRARIPSESGRGAIEHRGGPPESGGADMEVCYSYMRKARSLRVGASTASVGQSVGHAGGCRVAAVRKARRQYNCEKAIGNKYQLVPGIGYWYTGELVTS